MTPTTLRRQRLTDAAISTLAHSGMRGLTHRAVDQTAEVPAGSCSYYFRTRQELLQAAVERLAELDITEIDERPALTGPASTTQIAEAAAGLVEHWTTAGRERMLARYELALEAPRRPGLRAALHTAGSRHRALAENMLAAAGAPDPAAQANAFVSFLDGILFNQLTAATPHRLTPEQLRRTLLSLIHTCTGPQHP
ncbi:putative TetR family transcriptional regulator [Streptomyces sp. NBRC 110611]|uniref:TetR/AcrR family transcriptional regulator n=1 Tax=Streptomyces sp. NBRC 110611 TaxID=1621259 RepID=UPI00082A2A0A|nr:TetR/AcrR family transcriptional regulator [Streptomyces sp. NBRC 110611]GAU70570.1 putative TetR family transcriptional regulator [Streptomyces sp. NBRC 110611]